MQLVQERQAIGDRHDQVDQRHGDAGVALMDRQRLRPRLGHFDRVSLSHQQFLKGRGQPCVVVDHENPAGVRRKGSVHGPVSPAGRPQIGSSTAATVPRVGPLSMRIEPPCSRTMLRAMARPSPVPLPGPFVV